MVKLALRCGYKGEVLSQILRTTPRTDTKSRRRKDRRGRGRQVRGDRQGNRQGAQSRTGGTGRRPPKEGGAS